MSTRAFTRFLASEYFSGFLLLLATAGALILANSPWAENYWALLRFESGFSVGQFSVHLSTAHWINDGLMSLFFLVVGLEIKREFLNGELSSKAKAALPLICAAGGVIAPALLYMVLNRAEAANWRGWAIPTATDIAFALGLLALGPRVPLSLKIFLTALAIIDDLIAILIIALYYGGAVQIDPFLFAIGIMFCLFALNLMGIRQIWPYLALGAVLWVAMLQSGLHAVLAGVLLAVTVPVDDVRRHSPLHRLEEGLHPLSAYIIMPVFALANAGLSFKGATLAGLFTPLAFGIAFSLFIGKQAGIFFSGLLASRMKWAALPEGASLAQFYAVAVLAGVGFTMSLFIGDLAFETDALANQVRLGVIAGSLLSAVAGLTLLYTARPAGQAPEPESTITLD